MATTTSTSTIICDVYGDPIDTCRCTRCAPSADFITLQVPGHGWFKTTEKRLAANMARGRKALIQAALNQYEGMTVEDETNIYNGKPYNARYMAQFNTRTLAFIADNL